MATRNVAQSRAESQPSQPCQPTWVVVGVEALGIGVLRIGVAVVGVRRLQHQPRVVVDDLETKTL